MIANDPELFHDKLADAIASLATFATQSLNTLQTLL